MSIRYDIITELVKALEQIDKTNYIPIPPSPPAPPSILAEFQDKTFNFTYNAVYLNYFQPLDNHIPAIVIYEGDLNKRRINHRYENRQTFYIEAFQKFGNEVDKAWLGSDMIEDITHALWYEPLRSIVNDIEINKYEFRHFVNTPIISVVATITLVYSTLTYEE